MEKPYHVWDVVHFVLHTFPPFEERFDPISNAQVQLELNKREALNKPKSMLAFNHLGEWRTKALRNQARRASGLNVRVWGETRCT